MGPKRRENITSKYRVLFAGGKYLYEHRVIAEKALGRPLKETEIVHHVDGNGKNNARTNLVICPDDAYHKLIHLRQAALEATGFCHWRKCAFCGKWDSPQNLRFNKPTTGHTSDRAIHVSCYKAYRKKNKHKWASAQPGYKP